VAGFQFQRAAVADRLLDRLHGGGVLLEPPGPAGVAHPVVEHGAPPQREFRGRNQARRVRPVLEQDAFPVEQPVERRAVVDAEPVPQRQVVRALEHVDRVELDAAGVRREALEAPGGQAPAARAIEVLALDEERGDGAWGDDRRRHAGRDVAPEAGYARPSTSTRCTMRAVMPRARAPRSMWSRQPGFEATTSSGATLTIESSFCSSC